jgi:hypothetical protein
MNRRAPYMHAKPLAVSSNVNGSGVGEGDEDAGEALCVMGPPCDVTDVFPWPAFPLTPAATGPLNTCATVGPAGVFSVFAMAFWPPPAPAGGAAWPLDDSLVEFAEDCVVVEVEAAAGVEVDVELTVVNAALEVVTDASVVDDVVLLPAVAAALALPDTPDAAASIPLASING